MKTIILAVIAVLSINSLSFAGELTTSEKLEAAKKKQLELAIEIAKLEKPSVKEVSKDALIQAKRAYVEISTKVTQLTKEIVEKINKK